MYGTEKSIYLRPEEASKLLKVTVRTLEMWETKGKISCHRTKGGHRRFLREEILGKIPEDKRPPPDKINFCYCRVSTPGQKSDLERQVEFFRIKYPNHTIIKDIGSGINFNRKGLNSILDTAIKGNLGEVVVTHKDRLCRFGYDLIERIISTHSNGKIVVLDQQETSPEKELINDLLSIITVFSCRLYGLRSHSLKQKIKQEASKQPEEQSEEGKESREIKNSENTSLPNNGRERNSSTDDDPV